MLYTYNIRYKRRLSFNCLGQFCLKPWLMSAPAQCFCAGAVMVLCGVEWSGLVWSSLGGQGLQQSEQPQTVQQRKRRHGNGAGCRWDRYQIALSVHSDRKRHMSANICVISTRVCKLNFKRTNAKQQVQVSPANMSNQWHF